ncbi:hypothetical protein ACH5RR_017520 [Cinchona calisaya]|uniref:Uncharacterized protein n=1 Tax=Cinchona calisaya TaxID=153742 RepID=A0ABD2ZKI9_9GENT
MYFANPLRSGVNAYLSGHEIKSSELGKVRTCAWSIGTASRLSTFTLEFSSVFRNWLPPLICLNSLRIIDPTRDLNSFHLHASAGPASTSTISKPSDFFAIKLEPTNLGVGFEVASSYQEAQFGVWLKANTGRLLAGAKRPDGSSKKKGLEDQTHLIEHIVEGEQSQKSNTIPKPLNLELKERGIESKELATYFSDLLSKHDEVTDKVLEQEINKWTKVAEKSYSFFK